MIYDIFVYSLYQLSYSLKLSHSIQKKNCLKSYPFSKGDKFDILEQAAAGVTFSHKLHKIKGHSNIATVILDGAD